MKETYDEFIGYPTVLLGRKIVYLLAIYLRPYGITPEQWTVLRYLGQEDGITQKELSGKSGKDPGTLARILDIMDRKNWIERKTNNNDRRSFLVCLTNEGEHLRKKLKPFIESIYENVFKDITEDQLECFLNCLEQLEQNIETLTGVKEIGSLI